MQRCKSPQWTVGLNCKSVYVGIATPDLCKIGSKSSDDHNLPCPSLSLIKVLLAGSFSISSRAPVWPLIWPRSAAGSWACPAHHPPRGAWNSTRSWCVRQREHPSFPQACGVRVALRQVASTTIRSRPDPSFATTAEVRSDTTSAPADEAVPQDLARLRPRPPAIWQGRGMARSGRQGALFTEACRLAPALPQNRAGRQRSPADRRFVRRLADFP